MTTYICLGNMLAGCRKERKTLREREGASKEGERHKRRDLKLDRERVQNKSNN